LDKEELRKTILQERESLGNREIAKKSDLIFQRVKTATFFREASSLVLYSPIRKEVNTESIFLLAKNLGKRTGFPVTLTSIMRLLLFEIDDLEELTVGTYGIKEPPFLEENLISLDKLDLLIMPGVAFDESGCRVGYGGGYYDRLTVEDGFRAVKMALAFDLQIVEGVPREPHDIKVDYIITESRMIECL
jgi:5-formyltetrahydrofolate cyclo-ligase